MKTVKLTVETKSWMRHLSPTAKSMLFALPMLMAHSSAFADTSATDSVKNGADSVSNSVKKGYRNAKGELCTKGTIGCKLQDLKTTAQNKAGDMKVDAKKAARKAD